jgi:cell filamentation protein
MKDEYQYDYEWDSKYCYPNSFILINKLGIKDKSQLIEAERKITLLRIYDLKQSPVKGNFDLEHLQFIHQYIFREIYSWAGQLRTVNIAKGNQFCNCMYIESGSKPIFDKLKKEDYLIGTSQDSICEKLAYYLGEINVIHPFREGNGRTQRVFIESLAQVAGYHVDFTNISSSEMIEASAFAFDCDYRKMENIFERITVPIFLEEQQEYIAKVAPPGSLLPELFHGFSVEEPELQEEQDMKLD